MPTFKERFLNLHIVIRYLFELNITSPKHLFLFFGFGRRNETASQNKSPKIWNDWYTDYFLNSPFSIQTIKSPDIYKNLLHMGLKIIKIFHHFLRFLVWFAVIFRGKQRREFTKSNESLVGRPYNNQYLLCLISNPQ